MNMKRKNLKHRILSIWLALLMIISMVPVQPVPVWAAQKEESMKEMGEEGAMPFKSPPMSEQESSDNNIVDEVPEEERSLEESDSLEIEDAVEEEEDLGEEAAGTPVLNPTTRNTEGSSTLTVIQNDTGDLKTLIIDALTESGLSGKNITTLVVEGTGTIDTVNNSGSYIQTLLTDFNTLDLSGFSGKMKDSSFSDCSRLNTVKINSGLLKLGTNMFQYCTALETVYTDTPTEGVVDLSDFKGELANSAFYGCTGITTVKLPAGSIPDNLFGECLSLEKVYFTGESAPVISDSAFTNITPKPTAYVPDKTTGGYEQSEFCLFFSEVVSLLPEITDTLSDLTVPAGQEAEFSITASSAVYEGITYQWEESADSTDGRNGTWVEITDEDTARLVLANVTEDMDGTYYRVKVTNSYGSVAAAGGKLTVISRNGMEISSDTLTITKNGTEVLEDIIRNTLNENGQDGSAITTLIVKGNGTNISSSNISELIPNVTFLDLSEFSGSFGTREYANLNKLSTVRLNADISQLSSYMFENCAALTTVYTSTLTEGVVDLSEFKGRFNWEGFGYCKSITAVKLPPTEIPQYMFWACNSLKTVIFTGDTAPQIGSKAFSANDPVAYVPDKKSGDYEKYAFTQFFRKVISTRPVITAEPEGLTVPAGRDAVFTAAASVEADGGLTYQWEVSFDSTNGKNGTWSAIPDENSVRLVLPASREINGSYFRLRIFSAYSSSAVTTGAKLTVVTEGRAVINLNQTKLEFGSLYIGEKSTQSIKVTGYNLDEIKLSSPDGFTIEKDKGWDDTMGGILQVTFDPKVMKVYEEILKISSSETAVTVWLTGKGLSADTLYVNQNGSEDLYELMSKTLKADGLDANNIKTLAVAGKGYIHTSYSNSFYIQNLAPNVTTLDLSEFGGTFTFGAFAGWTKLTTVRLNPDLSQLGLRMFQGCSGLTTLYTHTLRDKVVDLSGFKGEFNNQVFEDCVRITTVRLSDQDIPSGMFNQCTGLKKVFFTSEMAPLINIPIFGGSTFYRYAEAYVPDKTSGGYEKPEFLYHFSAVYSLRPSITVSPVDQIVPAGKDAVFTAAAKAAADEVLTFQWEESADSTDGRNGTWSEVTGGNTAALTMTGVRPEMDGTYYRVRIANEYGPVNSVRARLTVVAAGEAVINVSHSRFDMGKVHTGKKGAAEKLIITGYNLDKITLSEPEGFLIEKDTGWDDARGGTLLVALAPGQVKNYSEILTITSGDKMVKVTLTGEGVTTATLIVTVNDREALSSLIKEALAKSGQSGGDITTLAVEGNGDIYRSTIREILPNMTTLDLYWFNGYIDTRAFIMNNTLTTVRLNPNLDRLGKEIFYDCPGLSTVYTHTLTEGMVDLSEFEGVLGAGTFKSCESITTVKMPKQDISDELFSGCFSLETIIFTDADAPAIPSKAFNYISYTSVAYVPDKTMGGYEKSEFRKHFSHVVSVKPVITVPPADQSVPAGEDAVFTVTADAPMAECSYQWEVSDDSTDGTDGTWSEITGEHSSRLVLNSVSSDLDGNYYRARVYIDDRSVTSAGARLIVVQAGAAYLNVNRPGIEFGKLCQGKSVSQSILVTGYNLEKINLSSSKGFAISKADGWDDAKGGTLQVTFTPRQKGRYSGTLTIAAGDFVTEVTLTGEGVPFDTLIVAQNDSNHLYTAISIALREGGQDQSDITTLVVEGNGTVESRSSEGSYIQALLPGITTLDLSGFNGTLGKRAFAGSTLTTVRLNPNLAGLGEETFRNCDALTTVYTDTLTEKVIDLSGFKGDLGSEAFILCDGITAVKLPARDVPGSMFAACSSLKTVIFTGTTAPVIGFYAFNEISPKPVAYVPDGTRGGYGSESFRRHFSNVLWEAAPASAGQSFRVLVNEAYPVYTGKTAAPVISLQDRNTGAILQEGIHYTVKYKNAVAATIEKEGDGTIRYTEQAPPSKDKTPVVIITGKGNYAQTSYLYYDILKKDLYWAEGVTVSYTKEYAVPAKGGIKPAVTLQYNKQKLKAGKDYTLTYYSEWDPETSLTQVSEEGDYVMVVTGNGNYFEKLELPFTVTSGIMMSGARIILANYAKTQYCTGREVTLGYEDYIVVYKNYLLLEDEHYSVSYENNIEPGKARMIITGIGDFAGEKSTTFTIKAEPISKADIYYDKTAVYEGGKEICPYVSLSINEFFNLERGTDYTVEYKNNRNKGTGTIVIKGIGTYGGTVKKNFQIKALQVNEELTDIANSLFSVYTKGGAKPVPIVYSDGVLMVPGKDYTVSYKNNNKIASYSDASAPSITITGKGNCSGKYTETFSITRRNLNYRMTIKVSDVIFAEKDGNYKSKFTVVDDRSGKSLKSGTDFEAGVVYSLVDGNNLTPLNPKDRVSPGSQIRITITGKGAYTGTLSVDYRVPEKTVSKASFKIPQQTYSGKEITLTEADLEVFIGKGAQRVDLEYGKDYIILPDSYRNNIRKGTAKVTIAGIGEYGGTREVSFTIKAKKLW